MLINITAGSSPVAIGNGVVSPPVTLAAAASQTYVVTNEQLEELMLKLNAMGNAKVTYVLVESGVHVFRKTLAATGATGTLVDDVIVAPAQMGSRLRIIDTKLLVSTPQAATTAVLRDQAAGAGNALSAAIATSGAGRVADAGNASTLTSENDGATIGLYLRRDRAVIGEVVVTAVLEA